MSDSQFGAAIANFPTSYSNLAKTRVDKRKDYNINRHEVE